MAHLEHFLEWGKPSVRGLAQAARTKACVLRIQNDLGSPAACYKCVDFVTFTTFLLRDAIMSLCSAHGCLSNRSSRLSHHHKIKCFSACVGGVVSRMSNPFLILFASAQGQEARWKVQRLCSLEATSLPHKYLLKLRDWYVAHEEVDSLFLIFGLQGFSLRANCFCPDRLLHSLVLVLFSHIITIYFHG